MIDESQAQPAGYDDSLDVAVIGMAGRFPQASDVGEFWRNLRAGRCAVTFFDRAQLAERGVPAEALSDPNYVLAGHPLEGAELFDAEFFGCSPREAELMDPQHRVLLECAWAALEDAGYDPAGCGGPVGVYAGAGTNTYLLSNLAHALEAVAAVGGNQVIIGNSADFLATRVSYKLGLEGPSVNVQSACSTSLVTVVLAVQGLLGYQCDMAVAGGVAVDVLGDRGYLYQEDGLFSPDGYCRSYDAAARGTVGGSGVGLVVLKRLADAVCDGDHIHAVIRGTAMNNDGARRVGFTAPSAASQALVITTALGNAGVEADSIGYLEGHGTATILGDPIEFAALTAVFGGGSRDGGPEHARCALGSVKTNIGHLDAAAGIAGLIKAVLTVEHGLIPPTLHFTEPNPRIDLANSPFTINTGPVAWPTIEGPRRAGVSAFGLGGTNAHIVLEQAPGQPARAGEQGTQVLPLSARDANALESMTDRLADHLREHPDASLPDVAYTLQLGRRAFEHRRVLVADSVLDAYGALDARSDGRLLTGFTLAGTRRPVAFLFTGFGEQYPGMAYQLYLQEPVFQQALDRCAAMLRAHLDTDIRAVLFEQAGVERSVSGPAVGLRALLAEPQCTDRLLDRPLLGYPAVFAVEYALVELWASWGIRPEAMLGHSLGEYVAACVAGVFGLEDALALVVARARLIERHGAGAMVAIPMPERDLERFLDDEVALAAVNGPYLCVLSGTEVGIERVARRLDGEGTVCRRLATRYAFHSPLMDPVVEQYESLVAGVKPNPARIPFVSNLTGTWITDAEATDPGYWARHLRCPVRFADGVGKLWSESDAVLLEIGPGQTLCSSALQHPASRVSDGQLVLPSLPDAMSRQDDRTVLLRTVGRLWLAGVPVEWAALHAGSSRCRVSLPGYPFQHRRFWLDPAAPVAEAPTRGRNGVRLSFRDWFYSPSWHRLGAAHPDRTAEPATARWLVFADERGVGRGVAARLRALGAEVVIVAPGDQCARVGSDEFVVDPHRAEHYGQLAETLRAEHRLPQRVLHCWLVDPASHDGSDSPDQAEVRRLVALGFDSLVHWARAAERSLVAGSPRWDVVTTEVCQVTGDEPLCPTKATIQGVCRVVGQEYPALDCVHVDIPVPGPPERAEIVDRLLTELAGVADEPIVALRGRYRWGRNFRLDAVPDRTGSDDGGPALRHDGVYLLTGGLGRIGLTLAHALAERVQARLVLVGRAGLPLGVPGDQPTGPKRASAVLPTVRALEDLGAQVLVCAADVSDEAAMRAVVKQATERFGPINGVVHAAGSTGPAAHRAMAELGAQECQWHFGPKLHGVHILDRVLRGQPLDFALLCSSVASVLGGLGFAAYAAANGFLDAHAQSRQRCGGEVPWTSVCWEAWRFPGDPQGEAGIGAAVHQLAISPEEGRAVFEALLRVPQRAHVVVSTTDLGERVRLWSNPVRDLQPPARQHARPNLRNPYVAPSGEIENELAGIWQEILGVDAVGAHDNFFELGGSSLLGLRVVHRLREELRAAVPLTIVYEGPTIRTLAKLVGELRGSTDD